MRVVKKHRAERRLVRLFDENDMWTERARSIGKVVSDFVKDLIVKERRSGTSLRDLQSVVHGSIDLPFAMQIASDASSGLERKKR